MKIKELMELTGETRFNMMKVLIRLENTMLMQFYLILTKKMFEVEQVVHLIGIYYPIKNMINLLFFQED